MAKRISCSYGQNNLIHTLTPDDRAAVEPHLSDVDLPARVVLDAPDAPIRAVTFPVTGVGSMIAFGPNDRRIEAGLFGCEGMSGIALVVGADRAPTETIMQVGGAGRRMEAARLIELMEARPSIRAHLGRFVQTMFVQSSQTALSNGHSKLETRLARWLLMCHDRIRGDEMELTHEFLSVMLGVRRAGVTIGTHLLKGKGLIRAGRARIVILDREGLEEQAEGSCGRPEAEYARMFGPQERSGAAA